MKRLIASILVSALALCMLTGCGRQKDDDPAIPDDRRETSAETDMWYELKGGILTVRLPLDQDGYTWQISVGDETVLEPLMHEESDGAFIASFRALTDGETTVSFTCAAGASLSEIRTLQVECGGGKVAKIKADGIIPIEEKDDLVIAEMRESNHISRIMREHFALTCVSETWDGDGNWQYKTVTQFIMSDGRLWYDCEQYDESDDVVYCEAGYVSSDTPGALYSCEKDGLMTMTLCRAEEYESMISARWLARQEGDHELLLNKTENTEYDNITLQTILTNDAADRGGCETDYFIDSGSGLISGMERREYDSDGTLVSVTGSNVLYDQPRLMTEQAAAAVLSGEDPCCLTVVIDSGTELAEEQVFLVDRETWVEFESSENFSLFCDETGTQPMEWIDVTQNQQTVYVRLAPAES